jgi:hypothetical protein
VHISKKNKNSRQSVLCYSTNVKRGSRQQARECMRYKSGVNKAHVNCSFSAMYFLVMHGMAQAWLCISRAVRTSLVPSMLSELHTPPPNKQEVAVTITMSIRTPPKPYMSQYATVTTDSQYFLQQRLVERKIHIALHSSRQQSTTHARTYL